MSVSALSTMFDSIIYIFYLKTYNYGLFYVLIGQDRCQC